MFQVGDIDVAELKEYGNMLGALGKEGRRFRRAR